MSTVTPKTHFALSRRQLLFATGGASAALFLAACAPVTTPAPSQPASASEPQRGGTLRIAMQEAPGSLDPHLSYTIQDNIVRGAIYDYLIWNDPALQPQPALATAWEVAADQLSWTLPLRQGVTFHHGTAFTAADVVYSFERILGPDFGSPAQTAFRFVEKVEAVDDYTVRFILKSPNVDFPLLLGDPVNVGVIIPHDRTPEALTAEPSGTGPFRLTAFVPGESATFTRNESYWRTGMPYLDEVKHFYMPEQATQVAALTSGTIDLIWQLTTESMATLTGNPDVVIEQVESGAYQPIIMRLDQEPFTDVRVRQAFKYATDRAGMVQGVLQGNGVIGNDQPLPPVHPFAADLPAYALDVEKAKALLAEAGYPDGLAVTLYTADLRPGMVASAVVFQEMAKAAGITVTVEQVPGSNYWSEHWMQSALTVSNWNVFPSADTILSLVYHSTGAWNESGIKNAELDALIEAGRAESDPAKRQEIYAQVQQLIQAEGGTLVPYFRPSFYARHKNVQGVLYIPQGPVYLQEAWLMAG
ncbi:MAG: ABC transporter substrate-binding protein [Caldilineaceae bacterium]|jgi:peptide/nickel transport system substrate-binding protein